MVLYLVCSNGISINHLSGSDLNYLQLPSHHHGRGLGHPRTQTAMTQINIKSICPSTL